MPSVKKSLPIAASVVPDAAHEFSKEGSALKIRIKFAKEGTMKFIGHLDMMRYFQKVMRRANVDIRYSEGFSPHQIMSFAAPLGVGITSRGEYVDIEVLSTDSSEEMLRRINAALTEGVEALSYKKLPDSSAAAMSLVAAADYTIRFRAGYEPSDWDDFASGWEEFLKRKQILVIKKTKKGERETDIRPWIYKLEVACDKKTHSEGNESGEEADRNIRMRIAAGSAANLKPELVMQAYMESRGQKLGEFALLIHRDEVYANQSETELPNFCPLEQLGEDIE